MYLDLKMFKKLLLENKIKIRNKKCFTAVYFKIMYIIFYYDFFLKPSPNIVSGYKTMPEILYRESLQKQF